MPPTPQRTTVLSSESPRFDSSFFSAVGFDAQPLIVSQSGSSARLYQLLGRVVDATMVAAPAGATVQTAREWVNVMEHMSADGEKSERPPGKNEGNVIRFLNNGYSLSLVGSPASLANLPMKPRLCTASCSPV
jgi:hypothetical protein